ncbi:MAG: hypothetical protein JWP08_3355, partial [Bryobacterales bacterium]|nr:hypothetical protein [Bryobacterales bacterium]
MLGIVLSPLRGFCREALGSGFNPSYL